MLDLLLKQIYPIFMVISILMKLPKRINIFILIILHIILVFKIFYSGLNYDTYFMIATGLIATYYVFFEKSKKSDENNK